MPPDRTPTSSGPGNISNRGALPSATQPQSGRSSVGSAGTVAPRQNTSSEKPSDKTKSQTLGKTAVISAKASNSKSGAPYKSPTEVGMDGFGVSGAAVSTSAATRAGVIRITELLFLKSDGFKYRVPCRLRVVAAPWRSLKKIKMTEVTVMILINSSMIA